jgi:trehalose 6-phosphate phosphatase
LPNIDWAKGDAVQAIMRHVEAHTKETVWPVYIGDDKTDEDAFETVGTSGMTIAVTRRAAGASFVVDNTTAVEAFLKRFCYRVDRSSSYMAATFWRIRAAPPGRLA